MSGFIHIETERLILRDHRMADLPSHHLLFSDEEVMEYLPEIRTGTLFESYENLKQSVEEIGASGRRLYFLRMEKKNGDHVGEMGYTVLSECPAGKTAGLGYFLNKRYWGRGYAAEAALALLDYAFAHGVYRLVTGCNKNNAGSERVMVKCGFRKEAEFKDFGWKDGALYDRVEYALLKSEWENRRKNGT